MPQSLGNFNFLNYIPLVPQIFFGNGTTQSSCTSISAPEIPGAEILSITGVEKRNLSIVPSFLYDSERLISNLDVCDVNITLTHPGEHDTVLIELWLPLDRSNWNGRFQARGGGGFSCGNVAAYYGSDSASPAAQGYSIGWTDGGHVLNYVDPSAWALDDDGQVNRALVLDFASRSIHDLAVAGKAVSTAYYGREPSFSYFQGCSTAGRQGYKAAQKYPHDFDGILASAPSMNWPSFIPAEYWPQVVMNEAKTYPTPCEFNAFYEAAIKECDLLDGLEDGVIDDPMQCKFDPRSLVGTTIACGENVGDISITSTTADIVQKILEGPRSPDGKFLWYGLLHGTSFSGLAATMNSSGTMVGVPMAIGYNWIKYFLHKDPTYDGSTMTYAEFARIFEQSNVEFHHFIGDDADLTPFRLVGGKLLSWHGLSDNVIFAQGTIDYRQKVEAVMGGSKIVDDFYRFFLAPGGGHCVPGAGGTPNAEAFEALVAWVEKGEAPETLTAYKPNSDGTLTKRKLCPWPLGARYDGHGDPASTDSFSCVKVYEPLITGV